MYKLIVSDMDGTLLNSIGEISERNLNAVKKAEKMGVEFAIVTGRPYVSVKGLLKANDIVCHVIGCNGAQVTDKNGKLVKAHYLNKDSLLKIMKEAEKNDAYYQIYNDSYIYTKSRIQMVKMLKNYSGKSIKKHINIRRIIGGIKRLFFTEVRVVRNLMEFVENNENNFYKVQISSLNQKQLNKMREKLMNIPDIDITSSSYFNIEIGPKGVTKGTAVAEFAEIKNLLPEEIIAIGDNYNDISMLQYAGCGVAMGNAEQAVKDVADFYTKSNDDDGVAYAIERLIFDNMK